MLDFILMLNNHQLNCWETLFIERINVHRKKELQLLAKDSFFWSVRMTRKSGNILVSFPSGQDWKYFFRSAGPRELLPHWRAGPLPGGGEVPGGLRRRPRGHVHPGALHRPAPVPGLPPVDCDQLSANLQCLQPSPRYQVRQDLK